jgi:hypothetical protein
MVLHSLIDGTLVWDEELRSEVIVVVLESNKLTGNSIVLLCCPVCIDNNFA